MHHIKVAHYRASSKMQFEWQFAGGSIMAGYCMLAGKPCVILSFIPNFFILKL